MIKLMKSEGLAAWNYVNYIQTYLIYLQNAITSKSLYNCFQKEKF